MRTARLEASPRQVRLPPARDGRHDLADGLGAGTQRTRFPLLAAAGDGDRQSTGGLSKVPKINPDIASITGSAIDTSADHAYFLLQVRLFVRHLVTSKVSGLFNVFFVVFLLARATAGPERGLQCEAAGGRLDPGRLTERAAPLDAPANRLQFVVTQRLVAPARSGREAGASAKGIATLDRARDGQASEESRPLRRSRWAAVQSAITSGLMKRFSRTLPRFRA